MTRVVELFVIMLLFYINFSYKPCLCNGCHNLTQKAKKIDYFWNMRIDDTINFLKSSNSNEKGRSLSDK